MGKVSITQIIKESPKPLTQKELEEAIISASLPTDGLEPRLLEKPLYVVGFDGGYTHPRALLVKTGDDYILMPLKYLFEHREALNISQTPKKILEYLKSLMPPKVPEFYCIECLQQQMNDRVTPPREI